MGATAAARIAADPRVLLVQPDGAVNLTAQTMPTGIDRVDAELSPTAKINVVDEPGASTWPSSTPASI